MHRNTLSVSHNLISAARYAFCKYACGLKGWLFEKCFGGVWSDLLTICNSMARIIPLKQAVYGLHESVSEVGEGGLLLELSD